MIRVLNVYHMLSYAFSVLKEQGYKSIETESFENTADLFAEILIRGVSIQIKRGLGRTYIPQMETLSAPKGKINFPESIKTRSIDRRQLVCTNDDFSVNTRMNQIIKSTMIRLLSADINRKRKKDIRKLLMFFGNVDVVNLNVVDWHLQFNRNNQTYRMLISVCWLVVKGLIQTNTDGTTKLMDFLDRRKMFDLYQNFILEYYKKEHPEVKASAPHIKWQLDDDVETLLPIMRSDIVLSKDEKTLIIDAKYFTHIIQEYHGNRSIRSGHLYQIFTYVKNKEFELKNQPHVVSGMLLYAKTDEDINVENDYHMSGNTISIRTLDLNSDFTSIRAKLDQIVSEFFGSLEERN